MRWFFLSGESLVKLLLATLVIVNLFPLFATLFWIAAVLSLLLLLRKNKVDYKDSLSINPELFMAPADGKILSISSESSKDGADALLIRVAISWLRPIGLYLPCDCSVEDLNVVKGKGVWRFKKDANFTNDRNRYSLTFRNKTGNGVLLDFLKCPFGLAPRLYVSPGDKGKSLACFGYLPLGGSLNITLPGKTKALVAPGDNIKAGQTAMAAL